VGSLLNVGRAIKAQLRLFSNEGVGEHDYQESIEAVIQEYISAIVQASVREETNGKRKTQPPPLMFTHLSEYIRRSMASERPNSWIRARRGRIDQNTRFQSKEPITGTKGEDGDHASIVDSQASRARR
jgi:hypothetical protein